MICFSDIWHKYHLWFQTCLKFHLPNGSWTISKHHLWYLCQISLQIILKGKKEGGSLSWKGELHNFSFQQTVILFQLNLFNIEKQKQTVLHHFLSKCYIKYLRWNVLFIKTVVGNQVYQRRTTLTPMYQHVCL